MQHDVPDDLLRVPEPWTGDLEHAPLLFVASNPSIDDPMGPPSSRETYPTRNWTEARTIDFFEHRFDKAGAWTRGLRTLTDDGRYPPPAVRFWAAARARAAELIPDPVPGRDFVLTEVVHCKSAGQDGAWEAAETCANAWLDPILALSAAPVIVVLGEVARYVFTRRYGLRLEGGVDEAHLGGHPRLVASLPHPNAHMPRSFGARFGPAELELLRKRVASASRSG